MATMSTLATPQTTTTTWNIDPVHSVAEFKVKHMMISKIIRTARHTSKPRASWR